MFSRESSGLPTQRLKASIAHEVSSVLYSSSLKQSPWLRNATNDGFSGYGI